MSLAADPSAHPCLAVGRHTPSCPQPTALTNSDAAGCGSEMSVSNGYRCHSCRRLPPARRLHRRRRAWPWSSLRSSARSGPAQEPFRSEVIRNIVLQHSLHLPSGPALLTVSVGSIDMTAATRVSQLSTHHTPSIVSSNCGQDCDPFASCKVLSVTWTAAFAALAAFRRASCSEAACVDPGRKHEKAVRGI